MSILKHRRGEVLIAVIVVTWVIVAFSYLSGVQRPALTQWRVQIPLPSWPTWQPKTWKPSEASHKPSIKPPNKSPPAYSIKPIAYVFPQFHQTPENDRLWGENFTDWDNVRKYETNKWDMEILRPAAEVGYYDLLDKSTRTRWTKLVHESGIYGLVFHHYWFGDGKPVLHKPLEAMLADGQPDVPFMLNWANHPWVSTWLAGKVDTVLIDQVYGDVTEWRLHFNWLLPFFRHKNYIRSNGKLQFSIHNPQHMGDKNQRMFSAWKRWAREAGLGELDIIQTRVGMDDPNLRGPADAIGEFTPYPAGFDGTAQPLVNRLSTVYHHGVMVGWDNTPRHAPNRGDSVVPLRHPKLWKREVVETMRRIKSDPNPHGEENFLFINALNEWAEGNVLEPSVQWGTQWLDALREAIDEAETIPWRDEMIDRSEDIAATIEKGTGPVDVCVLIRVDSAAWPFLITTPVKSSDFRPPNPINMLDMLRSLTLQKNPLWRAVAFRSGGQATDVRTDELSILESWDPRITWVDVDSELIGNSTWPHLDVVDEVIANLPETNSECAGASHLLITTPHLTYSPTAFDVIRDSTALAADMVPLNYITQDTTSALLPDPASYDGFCTSLKSDWKQLCVSSLEASASQSDLSLSRPFSATLLSQAKLRGSSLKLEDIAAKFVLPGADGSDAVLEGAVLTSLEDKGWMWRVDLDSRVESTEDCHVQGDRTYPTCNSKGWLWIHVPNGSGFSSGCHTFTEIEEMYGEDPRIWDLEQWHEDGFCLRLSETTWREEMETAT